MENYYNCYYYYVLTINFLIFSFVYFIQKSISVQNAKRFIFNVKVYFRGTVECIFDLCNLPSNFQKHSRSTYKYIYIFAIKKENMYLFFFKWDLQIVTDWVSEIQVSGTYIKVIFKMLTYISGFMRRVLITSTHHFMSANTTVSKFNYIYYYNTFMHFQKYCHYILYQYLLWFIFS